MYDNSLNCWFYDEDVTPDDMKLISKTFAQFCWAANGGYPLAVGITPIISGGNINVTKGFVYFGETSDTNYIERTGVNQLYAFVNASVVSLVAQTCYLYIKPVITYDANIRVATVTGELYTSTNVADEGIQIASIVSGVITAINSINPLGATALQRGTIMLSLLDAYGKLSANNSWTGQNTFTGVTKVPTISGTTDSSTNAASTAFVQGIGTLCGKLGANNSWTGLNSFSQIPKVGGINTQGEGIVASGSNANGSWVKFANGLIMQTGIFSIPGKSNGITVEFPTPMPNLNWRLSFAGQVTIGVYFSYQNNTTTSFFAQGWINSSTPPPAIASATWMAIGGI